MSKPTPRGIRGPRQHPGIPVEARTEHPVADATTTKTETDTATQTPTHTAAADTKTAGATTKLKNGKTKQSLYLLDSTIEALKNAAEALAGTPGAPRGISDLADVGIQDYITQLERKYNNSEPFPQRTGPLARGPRIR